LRDFQVRDTLKIMPMDKKKLRGLAIQTYGKGRGEKALAALDKLKRGGEPRKGKTK
jgi:hypothetical protein